MKKQIVCVLCVCVYLLSLSVVVYGEEMAEFPPLPENGRGHFAIYREASRDNRIELTMFDVAGETWEDERYLVWDNALYVKDETSYGGDMKYYLDDGQWILFEQGCNRISDNIGELLYADLNYLRVYALPEELERGTVTKGDNGYYIGVKRSLENQQVYQIYYTRDLIDFVHIGRIPIPTWEEVGYSYGNEIKLGRLDGALVCVFEPYAYIPAYAIPAGHSEGPLLIYGLDGKFIRRYVPDKSTAYVEYDWENAQFEVTFHVITESVQPGCHSDLPRYYNDVYTTTDFEEFTQLPDRYYEGYTKQEKRLWEREGNCLIEFQSETIPYIQAVPLREYQYIQAEGAAYRVDYEERYTGSYERKRNDVLMAYDRYSTDGVYFKKLPADRESDAPIWLEEDLLCMQKAGNIYKTPLQYEQNVFVRLDNIILGFEQPPVLENGHTLVPMRFLLERMGAEVQWDARVQGVDVTWGEHSIELRVGERIARVDGETMEITVPARLIGGKMMVPLRFLAEQMGFQVEWDEEHSMAVVKSLYN